MEPTSKLLLSGADYAIFGTTLLLSAAIGLYFQFASKKGSKDDYLLGGRDMPILPVAFSLMATFMSATTFIGIPAEMYLYGTNMTFMNVGFALGPIIAAYVFLPIYFANKVSTSYEYLEKRFGKTTRKLVSAMSTVNIVLFTSATIYAPALALSAVTNLSLWMSVVAIGVVCSFTSALGGMKSVLWADVIQALLMFISLFTIIIIGCRDLGGISNVFRISYEGGRVLFPKVSLDPSLHYTIFNVVAQGLIITTSEYGAFQTQVQRMLSVKNINRSRRAVLLSIPMVMVFQLSCCMCGLIVYAYFRSCDPLTSPDKPIKSPDQLLPYLIVRTMRDLPGLPGLCITGVFSASLSTVSSGINSLASIATEDWFPALRKSIIAIKAVSFFVGALCIGLAFMVSILGNIIKASVLIVSMEVGPSLGLYLLAVFSRKTNEKGVLMGFVSGVLLAACMSFIPTLKTDPFLPLSKECPHLESNNTLQTLQTQYLDFPTSTMYPFTTSTLNSTMPHKEENPFPVAYMWISTLGLITSLVVGYTASRIISCFEGEKREVPDIYLSPVRLWLSKKASEMSGKMKKKKMDTKSAPEKKNKDSSVKIYTITRL